MNLALHAGTYDPRYLECLMGIWREMLDRWRLDRAVVNVRIGYVTQKATR